MSRSISLTRPALVAALLGLSLSAAPALAQDDDPALMAETAAAEGDPANIEAGFQAFKDGGCAGCHGWGANGDRIGENPEGPSLRATPLDAIAMYDTISCGRPGTGMPHFDPQAYSDGRCYGLSKADLVDMGTPVLSGNPLSPPQIINLVTYLQNDIVGRPNTPTVADCQAYYGARPFCANQPETDEEAAALEADAAAGTE
ncbi:c-type cytochrome [Pseudoroseicyclus sp. H15]